jgi:hypothetical protein
VILGWNSGWEVLIPSTAEGLCRVGIRKWRDIIQAKPSEASTVPDRKYFQQTQA